MTTTSATSALHMKHVKNRHHPRHRRRHLFHYDTVTDENLCRHSPSTLDISTHIVTLVDCQKTKKKKIKKTRKQQQLASAIVLFVVVSVTTLIALTLVANDVGAQSVNVAGARDRLERANVLLPSERALSSFGITPAPATVPNASPHLSAHTTTIHHNDDRLMAHNNPSATITIANNNNQLLPNHSVIFDTTNDANPASSSSFVFDDTLLNEIITPVVLDEVYDLAKESIVRHRRLENKLIRDGKFCQQHYTFIPTHVE
ncbi:hypothetical protein GZH46_00409, partial [Fragariocoptes setiger]